MRRIFISQLNFMRRLNGVTANVINKKFNAHKPVSCVKVSTGLTPKLSLTASNTKAENGNKHNMNIVGLTINDICLLVSVFNLLR